MVQESLDGFRADVQGLRALAVVAVLAFHAGMPGFTGGYVGVDVFFVISGFVITGLMLRDTHGGRRLNLATFYARRARRILPAAATVIVATLALVVVYGTPLAAAHAVRDAMSAALFASNVRFAGVSRYFGGGVHSDFQQYWSLSVEEQFYLVWPLVFFVLTLAPLRWRRRALALGVAAITLGSFVLSARWAGNRAWLAQEPVRAFFLLQSRAWELGLGALLAVVAPRMRALRRSLRFAIAVAGLTMIAVAVVGFDQTTAFPGFPALLPTLGTAAVLAAGIAGSVGGPVTIGLESRIAQLLGRYSFSLYLWHWPVLTLIIASKPRLDDAWPLRTLAMLAITVPLSVLTYHVIENPIRESRALRVSAWRAIGVGGVAIAIALTAGFAVDTRTGKQLRTDRVAQVATRDDLAVAPTEFVPRNLTPSLVTASETWAGFARGKCQANCDVSGSSLVIFGDSHAEHLVPGLQIASETMKTPLTEYTYPGCTLFPVNPRDPAQVKTCSEFVDASIAAMQAHPPGVIVVSTRGQGGFNTSPQLYDQSVRSLLTRLPTQSQVVVVSETPIASKGTPECLAKNLSDTSACDRVWPAEVNAALRTTVESAGATFLDLQPVLCADGRCPAISGNVLIWADDSHLTEDFCRNLAPFFVAQLEGFV